MVRMDDHVGPASNERVFWGDGAEDEDVRIQLLLKSTAVGSARQDDEHFASPALQGMGELHIRCYSGHGPIDQYRDVAEAWRVLLRQWLSASHGAGKSCWLHGDGGTVEHHGFQAPAAVALLLAAAALGTPHSDGWHLRLHRVLLHRGLGCPGGWRILLPRGRQGGGLAPTGGNVEAVVHGNEIVTGPRPRARRLAVGASSVAAIVLCAGILEPRRRSPRAFDGRPVVQDFIHGHHVAAATGLRPEGRLRLRLRLPARLRLHLLLAWCLQLRLLLRLLVPSRFRICRL
mmetsp:Transcript_60441/g.129632  ORF Transcript_60441/g.129632 Transcript_60441/m.129632 type:complete len:288 (-) Transcript_60441:89-952(-)